MSEDTYVVFNIKNGCDGPISMHSNPLTWGKWMTSPPGQIQKGKTGTCKASGDKGSDTGTQGCLVYYLPDNESNITISFDIPYYASNQGSISGHGSGISEYCFNETDNTYKNVAPFPTSGSPTTYWYVGQQGSFCPGPASDFSNSFLRKVRELSSDPLRKKVDIASVAWAIGPGCIEGRILVELFNDACWGDALGVLGGDTFLEQRIDIVATFGLLSPRDAFRASLAFAELSLTALEAHPQVRADARSAIRLMQTAEAEGRLSDDEEGADLGRLKSRLEQATVTLVTAGSEGDRRPQAAISAVLAPLIMEPHRALAQSSICARLSAENEEERKRVAYEERGDLLRRARSTPRG